MGDDKSLEAVFPNPYCLQKLPRVPRGPSSKAGRQRPAHPGTAGASRHPPPLCALAAVRHRARGPLHPPAHPPHTRPRSGALLLPLVAAPLPGGRDHSKAESGDTEPPRPADRSKNQGAAAKEEAGETPRDTVEKARHGLWEERLQAAGTCPLPPGCELPSHVLRHMSMPSGELFRPRRITGLSPRLSPRGCCGSGDLGGLCTCRLTAGGQVLLVTCGWSPGAPTLTPQRPARPSTVAQGLGTVPNVIPESPQGGRAAESLRGCGEGGKQGLKRCRGGAHSPAELPLPGV